MNNSTPTLSVIIPTFNECGWLTETILAIDSSLALAKWTNAEIIVVNDGSTDQTVEVLNDIKTSVPLHVLTQENLGRFEARYAGLKVAKGELTLLLDSRVRTMQPSMQFIRDQLASFPDRVCWNGDVIIDIKGNPFAAFWSCLVKLAWRRYFKHRTLTSFNISDYDYFPKGTGFFIAPSHELLEACHSFKSLYNDNSMASDDTHLIRPLAEKYRIHIGPEFMCTYHSRDSLKKFIRHTFFRGTTFVDGYLRKGSRFLRPLLILPFVVLLLVSLLLTNPLLVLSLGVSSVIFGTLVMKRFGCSFREISGFFRVLPVFGPVYFAGILRGFFLAWRGKF